jgi:hypothetical protein
MEATSRSHWDTLMYVPLRRAVPAQGGGTEAPRSAGEDEK